MATTISIIFDRRPGDRFYQETVDAVRHAIDASDGNVDIDVITTAEIDETLIDNISGGVMIGPGSPFTHPHEVDEVIRSARERGVPLVAT